MLLDTLVLADETGLSKRVRNTRDEFDRPVVVIKGDHRAVLEGKAVLDRILDAADRGRGNDVRDDVDDARFGIKRFNVDDGGRHLVEELVERRLDAAAGADGDRLARAAVRRQVDVLDVENAAGGDVDDRVGHDRVNLHDDIRILPVDLLVGRKFAVRTDDGRMILVTDVDRVVSEHAGSLARIILDARGVELATLEVEGGVLEPALVGHNGAAGHGEVHAFGFGQILDVEIAARDRDGARRAGELVNVGRAARGEQTALVERNMVHVQDAALVGERAVKRRAGLDVGRAGRDRQIAARSNVEFLASNRKRAGGGVGAREGHALVEVRRAGVVETGNVGGAVRDESAFVLEGTHDLEDLVSHDVALVDERSRQNRILMERARSIHGDVRGFGTERASADHAALGDRGVGKVDRAGVFDKIALAIDDETAGAFDRLACVDLETTLVDRQVFKPGGRVRGVMQLAARNRHGARADQFTRIGKRAGCKRRTLERGLAVVGEVALEQTARNRQIARVRASLHRHVFSRHRAFVRQNVGFKVRDAVDRAVGLHRHPGRFGTDRALAGQVAVVDGHVVEGQRAVDRCGRARAVHDEGVARHRLIGVDHNRARIRRELVKHGFDVGGLLELATRERHGAGTRHGARDVRHAALDRGACQIELAVVGKFPRLGLVDRERAGRGVGACGSVQIINRGRAVVEEGLRNESALRDRTVDIDRDVRGGRAERAGAGDRTLGDVDVRKVEEAFVDRGHMSLVGTVEREKVALDDLGLVNAQQAVGHVHVGDRKRGVRTLMKFAARNAELRRNRHRTRVVNERTVVENGRKRTFNAQRAGVFKIAGNGRRSIGALDDRFALVVELAARHDERIRREGACVFNGTRARNGGRAGHRRGAALDVLNLACIDREVVVCSISLVRQRHAGNHGFADVELAGVRHRTAVARHRREGQRAEDEGIGARFSGVAVEGKRRVGVFHQERAVDRRLAVAAHVEGAAVVGEVLTLEVTVAGADHAAVSQRHVVESTFGLLSRAVGTERHHRALFGNRQIAVEHFEVGIARGLQLAHEDEVMLVRNRHAARGARHLLEADVVVEHVGVGRRSILGAHVKLVVRLAARHFIDQRFARERRVCRRTVAVLRTNLIGQRHVELLACLAVEGDLELAFVACRVDVIVVELLEHVRSERGGIHAVVKCDRTPAEVDARGDGRLDVAHAGRDVHAFEVNQVVRSRSINVERLVFDALEDLIETRRKTAAVELDGVLRDAVKCNDGRIELTALGDDDVRIGRERVEGERGRNLIGNAVTHLVGVARAHRRVTHLALRNIDVRVGEPAVGSLDRTVVLRERDVVRFQRADVDRARVDELIRTHALMLEDELAVAHDGAGIRHRAAHRPRAGILDDAGRGNRDARAVDELIGDARRHVAFGVVRVFAGNRAFGVIRITRVGVLATFIERELALYRHGSRSGSKSAHGADGRTAVDEVAAVLNDHFLSDQIAGVVELTRADRDRLRIRQTSVVVDAVRVDLNVGLRGLRTRLGVRGHRAAVLEERAFGDGDPLEYQVRAVLDFASGLGDLKDLAREVGVVDVRQIAVHKDRAHAGDAVGQTGIVQTTGRTDGHVLVEQIDRARIAKDAGQRRVVARLDEPLVVELAGDRHRVRLKNTRLGVGESARDGEIAGQRRTALVHEGGHGLVERSVARHLHGALVGQFARELNAVVDGQGLVVRHVGIGAGDPVDGERRMIDQGALIDVRRARNRVVAGDDLERTAVLHENVGGRTLPFIGILKTDAAEAQLGAGARHGRRSLRHGIGLFTLLADEHQFLGVLHGHACCIVDAGKADGVQHAVVADGNGLTFALKVAVDVDDVGEADACVMKLVYLGGVEHAVDTHAGNIALEDKLSCVSKLFFECLDQVVALRRR